jgi:hypothetical protein
MTTTDEVDWQQAAIDDKVRRLIQNANHDDVRRLFEALKGLLTDESASSAFVALASAVACIIKTAPPDSEREALPMVFMALIAHMLAVITIGPNDPRQRH